METSSPLNVDIDARVKLSVRDLSVYLSTRKSKGKGLFVKSRTNADDIEKQNNAQIITKVSLDVAPGQVLAILGGSGSGKTTLLNTLSHRVTSNVAFKFEGLVKFNDHTNIDNIRTSYLLQDDSFLPNLTVYETLKFAADLKLPSHVTSSEKKALIGSILTQLGIERIAGSFISNSGGVVNLSGGERRLVSLAIQLLNKPSLLFLDEPTTGLDANSSIRLLTVLHKLAKDFGIAIVLTIHQPRYEILEKIDSISILAKDGKLVYFGSVPDSIGYFEAKGFNIQENVNLADFLVGLSMHDQSSPEMEAESFRRVSMLVDSWNDHKHNVLSHVAYENTFAKKEKKKTASARISLLKEIQVLTKRTFLISIRDRFSLLMLDVGILVISVILGWLFYKPKHNLSGIRTLQSVLYVMLETLGFVPLYFELSRLWTTDGKMFFKEKNEKIISVPGWLISRRIAKFCTEDFPITLGFCLITYFMWGLRGGPSYFLIYFSISLLINIGGSCCAMLCFAAGRDFITSSIYTNVFYQLQNNGCGFFVNAKTMPVYVRWVKYVAFFWYGYGAASSSQFTDWKGDCTGEDCSEVTGTYILQTLGYSEDWVTLPICILLCWAVGFYTAAGIVLHYKSTDVIMSKAKKNSIPISTKKTELTAISSNNAHKELLVNITLENIELWVSPKKLDLGLLSAAYQGITSKYFDKESYKSGTIQKGKKLLNGINAKFTAGKVNAVMGPSGSGKSSLLNHLAGRLSKKSKFVADGSIILNNTALPRGKSLGNLCSYVIQHDDHLIPTLTVRETLYYQAKIRLPQFIQNDAHLLNERIDELIMKMGLKDCENILIGDDFKKGISGGQKKRVAIAVQLLDDSKLLLLDEPTSGLDSFTAAQILQLLNELAQEDNRTIIMTIHQPNQLLFEQFSHLLLLGRGGDVIYNGYATELNSYFRNLGYPCPKLTNIADHALDLVSRNINEDSSESQARIAKLKDNFSQNRSPAKIVFEDNFDTLSKLIVTKCKKSFRESYPVLARRQMLTMLRDPSVIGTRIIQVIATGGIQALFFAPLSNKYDSISNRLGLVQETMNLMYIGFLNNVSIYPKEVSYFATEYIDGVIDIEAFFLAYLSIELPFEVVGAIAFALLVGVAPGLTQTAGAFFVMFFVSLVTVNAGESVGIIIVSLFDNLEIAINVLSNLMTIGIFMAGTMSLQAPKFFKAWNYISPLKFGVGIISKLGFQNQVFECEVGDNCTLSTGEAVLKYYGLESNFKLYMMAMAIILIVYRIIAYVLLCLKFRMK